MQLICFSGKVSFFSLGTEFCSLLCVYIGQMKTLIPPSAVGIPSNMN